MPYVARKKTIFSNVSGNDNQFVNFLTTCIIVVRDFSGVLCNGFSVCQLLKMPL